MAQSIPSPHQAVLKNMLYLHNERGKAIKSHLDTIRHVPRGQQRTGILILEASR